MGIRVPTGLRETTTTASKSDLLLFQCTECKNFALIEYPLRFNTIATYHVFQSPKAKDRAIDNSHKAASQKIYQHSADLAMAINKMHDYGVIDRCVTCPHCGHRQKWSAPQPKTPTKGSNRLTIFLAISLCLLPLWFFVIIFSILMALDNPILFIPIGILFCLLGFFCIRASRKKKNQKEIHQQEIDYFLEEVRNGKIEAPIYYNEMNLNALLEGPHRELARNMHTRLYEKKTFHYSGNHNK